MAEVVRACNVSVTIYYTVYNPFVPIISSRVVFVFGDVIQHGIVEHARDIMSES